MLNFTFTTFFYYLNSNTAIKKTPNTRDKKFIGRRRHKKKFSKIIKMEEIQALIEQGEFPRALHLCLQALESPTISRSELAKALAHAATCAEGLNDHRRAIDFYQELLVLQVSRRQQGGDNDDNDDEEDHVDVGGILNNIGENHLDLGEFAHALSYFEQIQAIQRMIKPGADDISRREADRNESLTLANIALCHAGLHKHSKAAVYYEKSLKLTEAGSGDLRAIAGSLSAVGECYIKLGEYPKALVYFERLLAKQREAHADQDHEEIAAVLRNIGAWLMKLNEYERALGFCKQSMQMRRRLKFSKDSDHLAIEYNNIGFCYKYLGLLY